jgi:hypothetical protein
MIKSTQKKTRQSKRRAVAKAGGGITSRTFKSKIRETQALLDEASIKLPGKLTQGQLRDVLVVLCLVRHSLKVELGQ